ncbi:MAG: Ig-like domain-containing protein [Gemmatimonadales bacterium]
MASGNGQEGIAGEPLADPLVVKVTDTQGRPVSGIVVTFGVTGGGGSLFVESTQSNAEGLAQDLFTLGGPAGDVHRVEARAVDAANGGTVLTATFTAVARPGAPAGFRPPESQERLFVPAGTLYPTRVAVLVVDRFDNPVPGAPIVFTPADNGGSITGAEQVTGPDGAAGPDTWIVGTVAGSGEAEGNLSFSLLTATIPGTSVEGPAISAAVVADHPVEIVTGPLPVTFPAGDQFDVPTRVVDQYANTVDQVFNLHGIATERLKLLWEVVDGGGCLIRAAPCTIAFDRYGNPVPIPWYLGSTPGTNHLRISVEDHPEIPPLVVEVTGT